MLSLRHRWTIPSDSASTCHPIQVRRQHSPSRTDSRLSTWWTCRRLHSAGSPRLQGLGMMSRMMRRCWMSAVQELNSLGRWMTPSYTASTDHPKPDLMDSAWVWFAHLSRLCNRRTSHSSGSFRPSPRRRYWCKLSHLPVVVRALAPHKWWIPMRTVLCCRPIVVHLLHSPCCTWVRCCTWQSPSMCHNSGSCHLFGRHNLKHSLWWLQLGPLKMHRCSKVEEKWHRIPCLVVISS